MTSQDNIGGDEPMVQMPLEPPTFVEPPKSAEPTDVKTATPPEPSRFGKLIIYAIVAIILIAACNAFSKEGGDTQSGSDSEPKGFFQSLFGGGDERDQAPATEDDQQDEFMLPDGKG